MSFILEQTSGSSGVDSFEFDQATPAASWVVVHNLRKFPSVVVVDSANRTVVGEVVYESQDQLTINFDGAFSGVAWLD
jgi:hypothetical protein